MEPRIHIDHTGFAHRTDANVIPAAYREVLDGKREALIDRTAERIAAILKDVDDFAGEFPGSGANAGELRSAALCFLDYLTPEIPGEPSGDAIMAQVVKIMGARS